MRAIRILGENVMKPRGLIGLARDTLDHCQPEINQALSAFLEPNTFPVMVHCTQGKDRTGLIIMLVLMILGAPSAAISYDYRLTDEALTRDKEQHEQRLREIRELGLPDEFGDTAPAMVPQMEKYLVSKYGGLDGYLDLIGFGEESRGRLRQLLLY
jgi:protein-tyrosine phosphatase